MAVADDITALYVAILKRQPDSGGLAAYVAAVNAGATLQQVAASIAASPEGQVVGIYGRELGRAPEPQALQADVAFLVRGGTAGALASNVASSNEAVDDINTIYQQVLEREGDYPGITGFQQALANGASLGDVRAAIALSPESQAHLNTVFQRELGRPAAAAPTAPFTQTLVNGGTIADVRAAIANSPEASNDIASAYQTAAGITPNTVALLAGLSELQSGTSINAVFQEIAQLATRSVTAPAKSPFTADVGITPETIGGSTPSFVYSLGNNDALVSGTAYIRSAYSLSMVDLGTNNGIFAASIPAFNPATDVIQIQSYQAANFSALKFADYSGGLTYPRGTSIVLGSSNYITIAGVSSSDFHASNFRFV